MNTATLTLDTMTYDVWRRLPRGEQERIRDMSAVTGHQLAQWRGWRVEVVTLHGDVRRFNVGQSTGWRPCLLAIHNRRAHGGSPVDAAYSSVKPLYRIREV